MMKLPIGGIVLGCVILFAVITANYLKWPHHTVDVGSENPKPSHALSNDECVGLAMMGNMGDPKERTAYAGCLSQADRRVANLAALQKMVDDRAYHDHIKNMQTMAEYNAEYDRQYRGYRFEARRWGDYLQISIRRDQDDATYAFSARIADLSPLKVEVGHLPDQALQLRYRYLLNHTVDSAEAAWGYQDGDWHLGNSLINPDDWSVSPSYPPDAPKDRPFAYLPQSSQAYIVNAMSRTSATGVGYSTCWNGWQQYANTPTTLTLVNTGTTNEGESTSKGELTGIPNFARQATDDRVVAPKSGIVIYAPAGLGQMVLERLMAASGKDEVK